MESYKIVVRKSTLENAGGGLFATVDFPANTYIGPYRGSFPTRSETMRDDYDRMYVLLSGSRCVDAKDPNGRLIMEDGRVVNVHTFTQRDWDRLRSLGVEWEGLANLTRFVNHGPSSQRNVKFCSRKPLGMGIVSTRKIRAGEEILVNYGASYWR